MKVMTTVSAPAPGAKVPLIDIVGRGAFRGLHGIKLPEARHVFVPDDLGSDFARLLHAQFGEGATERHAGSLSRLLALDLSVSFFYMHAIL